MKLSKQWLCEVLGAEIETDRLVNELTMLGLEVDSVTPAAGDFSSVVVGEILSAEPHPDAKRLRCCVVDIQADKPLHIVCGGANARAGIKVACATVGALLPSGFAIKETELRGQPSCGMLCSSSELGIEGRDDPEGGIMELPASAPVGQDLRVYLGLDDVIIDIELTPNRGDCASVWGVAREVAVLHDLPFSAEQAKPVEPVLQERVEVKLSADQACPRYCGRIIRNISTEAITPLWMQERLRRCGLRCIHPVVDIMNYVMLECGQPLHAFDLDQLDGSIEVRMAREQETVELLNDETCQLNGSHLVIADNRRVLAVAGVMGGADSGVTATTSHLFLESAYFDALTVRHTGSQLNINSDSRYRFERGVDYQLQAHAMERATALIVDICQGQVAPVVTSESSSHLPVSPVVSLRQARIQRVLGTDFSDESVFTVLQRLGLAPKVIDGGWQVTIPSFRSDLTMEIDLIEELARVNGYDNIPLTHQSIQMPMVAKTEATLSLPQIKTHLVARGFDEVISYSFIHERLQRLFCPDEDIIQLNNPISKDLEVMRGSLWPSLVASVLHNQNRQSQRSRFFEVGRVYQRKTAEIEQPMMLGMVATGSVTFEQWGQGQREVDLFDIKKDVESVISLGCRAADFCWKSRSHPALHPGQSVALLDRGEVIGFLGRLHPSLAADLGCHQPPILFEVLWSRLSEAAVPQFTSISKFPSMRRDLAVVLSDTVVADDILHEVRQLGGHLLTRAEIFDIYQGEGIESGQKSVALGLTFQDPSRTLVDSEVDAALCDVVTGLQQRFNATMRA